MAFGCCYEYGITPLRTHNTLPLPAQVYGYGLGEIGDLGSWFSKAVKSVKKVVKAVAKPVISVATAPIRAGVALVKGDVKGALGRIAAPWATSEATRGRILRRAGGVVTGAVTGLLTGGGPVGMIAGGVMGGLSAKQGVKGIKGYAGVALKSAAVAGAASIATGALAQAGYGAGLISQQTAQSAILASGKLGMVGTGISAGAPLGAAMQMAPVTSAIAKVGSVVYGVGTKAVGAGLTLASKLMQKPTAPTEEAVTMGPEGQFMDNLMQTQSVVPNATGMRADVPMGYGGAQAWGGGGSSFMPSPTGDMLPGQEPIAAGIFEGDNIKNMMLIGGLAILAIGFIKTK